MVSQKKRRRKKAKRYILHYALLIIFCGAVALTMCYTVFFKLSKIEVTGNSFYSEQEIIDIVGAQKGESLFKINMGNAENKLKSKLYYLKKVDVKRRLPTTLQVIIEEEEPMGSIYTPDGYTLISTTGKVLDVKAISPLEGVPRILGMENIDSKEGTYLKAQSTNPKEAELLPKVLCLQIFYKEMKEKELTKFDYVDLTDEYNLSAMYDGRMLIEFGTEHLMDRKMLFLKEALEGKTEDFAKTPLPQECTIDLSDPVSLRFAEMDIEIVKNPKGYANFGTEEKPPDGEILTKDENALSPENAPLNDDEAASTPQSAQVNPAVMAGEPAAYTANPADANADSNSTSEQPESVLGENKADDTPAPAVKAPEQSPQAQPQEKLKQPQTNTVPGANPANSTEIKKAEEKLEKKLEEKPEEKLEKKPEEKELEEKQEIYNVPSRAPIVNSG